MSAVYTRRIYLGMLGDMKNLEPHYAEMAQKGWMIDKIGLYTHRYRRIEPCQKRFFVDFLPQITAFDYPENEDAQEYRRLCEESGWAFIAANKQFHVFAADGDRPEPIPIHTDSALHAKIYLKASGKYEWTVFLLSLLLFWFYFPFAKGPEIILSNMLLFLTAGYCLFLPGYFWMLGFLASWSLRTIRAAKKGLPRVNPRLAKLRSGTFLLGALGLVACTAAGVLFEISGGMPPALGLIFLLPLAGMGAGLWLRRRIDTQRQSRAVNIALFVAIGILLEIAILALSALITNLLPDAQGPNALLRSPALTLRDAGITAPPQYWDGHTRGTPLVPVESEYWETNGEGALRTQTYRCLHRALADTLYEHFSKETDWEALSPAQAALWGAEKGIAAGPDDRGIRLLLLRDETVLRLSVEAEGAAERLDGIARAVRKLWPHEE